MTPSRSKEAALNVRVPIDGMSCAGCAGKVEKTVRQVPGVLDVSVNVATGSAAVSLEGGPADLLAVTETISRAGYKVRTDTLELRVRGMSCASCSGHVEKRLNGLPGVLEASVNLAAGTVTVVLVQGAVRTEDLAASVEAAGFEAEPVDTAAAVEPGAGELAAARRAAILAAMLTLPIFVLDMGGHIFHRFHHWQIDLVGQDGLNMLFFVLATIVLAGPGLRFYRQGIPALLHGRPDMSSLVMLGTSAAWGYSVVATFAPAILPEGTAHVYFEASAVIITLVLVGRYLEARAKGRTSDAIRKLVGLRAVTARVLRDGAETEVDIDRVREGDLVRVKPGEKIPVDGEVLEGSTYIDESMVTGEPVPALKEAESEVIGGTINGSGSITFRATRVGAETLLARIVRMVEEAQASKLPIQALVDKVTHYFVPAVMAAALVTFVIWMLLGPVPALTFALVNAVAVLIIACPCAMGLATPTSIMVGTGRAAEEGVLFRRGDALQALRDSTVVALDKTGTLTEGRPKLTDIRTAADFEEDELLRLLASIESRSEHPIATAVVEYAKQRGLRLADPKDFEAHPGLGVRGEVEGRLVIAGTGPYLVDSEIAVQAMDDLAKELAKDGKTPIFVAVDGRLGGLVAVADPIKPSTPSAIEALQGQGLRIAMVTGDRQGTAEAVARQLGIDEVFAEVLPGGKVEAISRMKSQGERVVFVGDGINDAPALAEAYTGVAIGTGTDIAIESADVVLMSGDLRKLFSAIALSRATMRNVKQNLFWAFAYNTALIPVAAGLLYPVAGVLLSPMLAAFAMAASSVLVVTNALRLRRYSVPMLPSL